MDKVLDLAETARKDFDADAVHDLRVALRRCRTMAETLSEVNPDPGWRKLKKASKPLFQNLGRLRDCQVERGWVKKIGGSGDALAPSRSALSFWSASERCAASSASSFSLRPHEQSLQARRRLPGLRARCARRMLFFCSFSQ